MSDTKNITGRMRAAFVATPVGDDRWQAVLDILHANGYRRCAEGQAVTQYCSAWAQADKACRNLTEKVIPNIRERAEKAEAEVERLREAANFAANAADGFRAELEQLRYDHEIEVERLTSERDAFMEMAERLTADLEALRARVFVRR